ncbi:50S ribosomal protein L21 [Candidatus Shapirobacteria bacterium CG2_30_35_20]|uniref:Large ribosomal subunit protein bL21 n=3 Tax=Candidatus Shapironibacteriota TaxID=1752721 RepID=A0A1J5HQM6_9BACT|nr:MAG: 50S ribosomal protein L21 [Candidatus Shapirobacteria bacterium CG2_30_35_20]PIV07525.1 MAG: 50S ribosomal protein L21 [Candidatus Shapirobacteria bacterium CG03_land_8_20_14_0_80_35_14]PIX68240.1 MAG: 50S ribosomal protein L21 [Candidatus Shapirobacteria bacterium CG_4_10_14_3_um_filter_35_13]
MKYAIIATSGTQYKIEENQIITVDKLEGEKDSTGKITSILLVVDDDKIEIGNPTVKNATVEYQIINQYQGDKVRVSKFKAKSRYRKTMGFRAQLTDIKIIKINL